MIRPHLAEVNHALEKSANADFEPSQHLAVRSREILEKFPFNETRRGMRKARMWTWSETFNPSNLNHLKKLKNDDTDSSQSSKRITRCRTRHTKTATITPSNSVLIPSLKVKPSSRCRALILSPLRQFRVFMERKRLYRKNKQQQQVNSSKQETSSTYEKSSCQLGQGGFGAVFRHVYNNRDVAIKQLHSSRHSSSSDFHSFCSELNAFRLPPSPYVVQAVAFSSSGVCMQVVTEFVEGKNLRQLIDDCTWHVSDRERLRLAFQVINGLEHCHNHLLLHLDVKPANIIVDERENTCKLSDFGCSRIATSSENGILMASELSTNSTFGTIAYKAPELFKGKKVTDRADIYSFSLVLWEILARRAAYDSMHPHCLIYSVVVGKLRPKIEQLKLPDGMRSKALVTLMESCWSDELTKRPCANNVQRTMQRIICL